MRLLPSVKLMSLSEVGELATLYADAKFPSQAACATHYGVSRAMMNLVCKGKRRPPKQMMLDMGLMRVDGYMHMR
jgi:hypothetical protein